MLEDVKYKCDIVLNFLTLHALLEEEGKELKKAHKQWQSTKIPIHDHDKKLGSLVIDQPINGVVNSWKSSEKKEKACVFGGQERFQKAMTLELDMERWVGFEEMRK